MDNKSIDISINPYYDAYDSSKQYTMVLGRAGFVEQAREFNEVQSITREYLRRISDTIYSEGKIISGCEIIISGTEVTISAGRIYLVGLIRDVAESHLTITGLGDETIGAILNPAIVTEAEDSTLLDPAQDCDNYSMAGAHRLKESVQIVANNNSAQVLYRLYDGALINSSTSTSLTLVNDVLASRTFDEVGNYKVSGLEIQYKQETSVNGTQLKLYVTAGKAYIKGYSITKQVSTAIYTDKALDSRVVVGEPKTYHAATAKYLLNNSPVKEVDEVIAQVSTSKTITRGNTSGGSDLLPLTPVVDITSITAGNTTYRVGIDFQLAGNAIDWSLSGIEPAIGSSYSCTWKYNKSLVQDTDFSLSKDDNGYYIDFTGLKGDVPVENTLMNITYDFYLSRQDVVVIDKSGVISVLQGASEILSRVASPDFSDSDYFRLGVITVLANSINVNINNNSIQRLTIEKLYSLFQRIEDLEYNDAISDLDSKAISGESVSSLKGILTDSFVNFDKGDITHAMYTASIDVTDKVLLPQFVRSSNKLVFNPSLSTAVKYGSNIYAKSPTTDYLVLVNQYTATDILSVNPYAIYTKTAILSVRPTASSEVSKVYTNDTYTDITKNILAYKYYRNSAYYENEVASLSAQGYSMAVGVNNSGNSRRFNNSNSSTTARGTKVTTSAKTRLLTYAPQDTLTINAQNFMPYQDNLTVTFDGVKVKCAGTSVAYTGTKDGTLKADVSGNVSGTFVVPPNTLAGPKKVTITSENLDTTGLNPVTISGSDVFTSTGIEYDTYTTINHINVVYKPYDPLAQSFSVNDSCFISGVTLYFASKDTVTNVLVELRGMEDGYPSATQYAVKVLTPNQVNVSTNGSAETTVTFDTPVFCDQDKQYCIVVESDSTKYQVFTATTNKVDFLTGRVVTTQVNSDGVLFTSSNGLTWTANQNMDLKLKICAKRFNNSAVVMFDPVTVNANVLFLDTDVVLSKDSNCTWEYRIDSDVTKGINNWFTITPYVQTYLSNVISKVQIRARFNGTTLATPVISSDLVRLETLLFKANGTYVTKNVEMSQPFTTIKQVVDLSLPSGTAATVQFCIDGNGTTEATWTTATLLGTSIKNTEYTQYSYQTVLPSNATATKFRARINLSTSNPCVLPKARNFMNIIK